MTTLAEHIIVAGAENRHPMVEKSMYDSWVSRVSLFLKGKKHDRMMLDSIDNGLLVYPTVEENGQTRPKKYSELTKAQQLQDDCETLYEYYWRFSQLINDMHTIRMTMQQVQVNTKFLNALPSEWSKFVTNVKLAKSLYTTNYDQLYAYLSQHEQHANEVREDPIECINKAMAFLSVVASRFPPSNNQLRTSSNPRNQATIQDGRVTGNVAAGPSRVVKCYNCQGEGHTVRHCTHPKRPRNAAWFKEKLMLAEAQEAGQILDEEQLAFLADPDNLDAYDLDCDDLSSAKAVLMANLSSYDLEVLSEVPYSDSYLNDMINQDVQEMQYSEQTHVDDFEDNEIHSGSNIISYSQYLQESQDAVIQDTNPSAPNGLLVLSFVEQMTNRVAYLDKENQTNKMVNELLSAKLER
ncbi:copia protein [Tanacetum coccineum]